MKFDAQSVYVVFLTLALFGCSDSVATVIDGVGDNSNMTLPDDDVNGNGDGNSNSNNDNANSNDNDNSNNGSECVNGETEQCGSDVGACVSGTRTCTDGMWGPCDGATDPVAEACNGLDDNCDGTADEGCPCVSGETRACGSDVGACEQGTQTCVMGIWGSCDGAVDPILESCNDIDDNCDGVTDDGCDDDGDGYCDASLTLVGTPTICANGGNDCDDTAATGALVNPGATEICDDGIDNDCLGGADFLDIGSCAPPTVDLSSASEVDHNDALFVFASFSFEDPGFGTPSAWTRAWAVIAASSGCNVSDPTLQNESNSAGSSNITFIPPSSVATLGCEYTLRMTVAGASFAESTITVINERPGISEIEEADFDGASWRMQVPVGTTQTVTAEFSGREDDVDVVFDWTGAGASVLACSSGVGSNPCEDSTDTRPFVSQQTINAPGSVGTETITVSVRDSFDGVRFEVPLIIEFVDCVWVAATGSPTGGASPGAPLNDLDAALNVSFTGIDAPDVCIVGSGTLSKNTVPLSATPSRNIYGGFDSSGNPSGDRPTIEVNAGAGLTFSADYDGTISGVTLVSTSTSAAPSVVTIEDSEPLLIDTNVDIPGGDGVTGIDINATKSISPTVLGGEIRTEGTPRENITGIRVRGAGATPLLSPKDVDVRNVTGSFARAIWLQEGTSATVMNTEELYAGGSATTVVVIDIDGGASTASAVIRDNGSIRNFATLGSETAVSIRLQNTDRVTIRGNRSIVGSFNEVSSFTAAVADGSLDRQGNLVRGNSTLLTIEDNWEIDAVGPFTIQCTPTFAGDTMDVTAGIFLAGTTTATIRNNPNTAGGPGIRGAVGSAHWAFSGRVYPPMNAGMWTIDTQGVTVTDNLIVSGSLSDFPTCPPVPESPLVVGFRDGLPSNGFATPTVDADAESDALTLERNGIVCRRPAEGAGSGFRSDCAALDLNSTPTSAARTVNITNNYITATRGSLLMGVRMEYGNGVVLTNNTIEADYLIQSFETPPPNGSLVKRGVYLVNVDNDGVDFINNIIMSVVDVDLDGTRIGILEETTGTGSSIGVFANNLVHVAGDPTIPMPVDFELLDSSGSSEFDGTAALNTIAGVTTSEFNLAADPLLNPAGSIDAKTESRLTPGSPAINAGRSAGAPSVDLYGNPRSGAIDIGHHEVQP
ncbi:MAG: putative metal-binding motif-containing protein [Myxococcota bacterium]